MTNFGSDRYGPTFGVRPHAFNPVVNPELFEGVLARRMIAFVIDLVVIIAPVALACLFILLFGFFTLGLGWLLFWLVSPATMIWAIFYYGMTMGGPASATIGMRAVDLEIRTWYGEPCYFLLGAIHGVLFWVLISALTPLVLLVGLLNERRRLLHDLLIGTVVINNERRATALGHYGWDGSGPRQ